MDPEFIRRDIDTWGEDHVMKEAEIAVMSPQAKECHGLPEAKRKVQNKFSPRAFKRARP